ncbi:MAG: threonine synthase [Paramuribaculum sp.]|nr:threonine synthase [Paramuribaculum sp.]
MLYYSINTPHIKVSLHEAVRRGVDPDGGIYMPERIPYIPKAFFNNIGDISLPDIGYVVANMLFGSDIDSPTIHEVLTGAINFDTPLVEIKPRIYALELFNGPSHSYKDFSARFMAQLLHHIHHKDDKTVNVLVATTGDAGEAIARAFYGMEGIRVIVLFPRNGIGKAQYRAISSLGSNIIPVEVNGSFVDCHRMVKDAFADKELSEKLSLMAANSFNIARLLAQTFYFFYAYARLRNAPDFKEDSRLVISVPAGNLGSLTAGIIARKMGLPVDRFVIARPEGDYFLDTYLATGEVDISSPTVPPNFIRLLDLFNNDHRALAREVKIIEFPVKEINARIASSAYPLEPNAAAALMALDQVIKPDETGIFFATTHPDKCKSDNDFHNRSRHNNLITLPDNSHSLKNFLLSLD